MIVMNDFKKEYANIHNQLIKKIDQCLQGGWYILGQEVEKFEKNFANYCDAKYCIGVANGLEAIQIALMSIDLKKADEVITVSNSAVATTLAITSLGAQPVFVDIDEFFHMDSGKLEQLITSKTKAILPVHLFGQVSNMKQILEIAKKHHIPVIEDACQAHGAEWKGKKVGSFGLLGCFSFYPTKNLGAYGDAGAIITNSKKLYEKCKKLRNYGQSTRYYHELRGINSRLDEIQATILNFKLPKLDETLKKRKAIAQQYFSLLKDVGEIFLPKLRPESNHTFHLYVIECQKRDELQEFLRQQGIETYVHYPVPIHKQQCYREFNTVSLPITEEKAQKILSLPIHPLLTQAEIKFVCKKIKEFYET